MLASWLSMVVILIIFLSLTGVQLVELIKLIPYINTLFKLGRPTRIRLSFHPQHVPSPGWSRFFSTPLSICRGPDATAQSPSDWLVFSPIALHLPVIHCRLLPVTALMFGFVLFCSGSPLHTVLLCGFNTSGASPAFQECKLVHWRLEEM